MEGWRTEFEKRGLVRRDAVTKPGGLNTTAPQR
jgi:hypothetical protein